MEAGEQQRAVKAEGAGRQRKRRHHGHAASQRRAPGKQVGRKEPRARPRGVEQEEEDQCRKAGCKQNRGARQGDLDTGRCNQRDAEREQGEREEREGRRRLRGDRARLRCIQHHRARQRHAESGDHERTERPAPAEGDAHQRAEQRTAEGRNAPHGGHDAEQLRPDGARKQSLDGYECQRNQRSAAKAFHKPSGQEHRHGGRRRADQCADPVEQRGERHVGAQRDIADQPSGSRAGDDCAQFVDGERPADELHARQVADHGRHDGRDHGFVGGMQQYAETDECKARQVSACPQAAPVRSDPVLLHPVVLRHALFQGGLP